MCGCDFVLVYCRSSVFSLSFFPGDLVVQHSHRPLSEAEYRAFWISWSNNELLVGTGSTLNEAIFLSYSGYVHFPIQQIAVSSWNRELEWKLQAGNTYVNITRIDVAPASSPSRKHRININMTSG